MIDEPKFEMIGDSPIADTLWARCMLEVRDKVLEEGADRLQFDDVDKLVLEKAKLPVDKLREFLK